MQFFLGLAHFLSPCTLTTFRVENPFFWARLRKQGVKSLWRTPREVQSLADHEGLPAAAPGGAGAAEPRGGVAPGGRQPSPGPRAAPRERENPAGGVDPKRVESLGAPKIGEKYGETAGGESWQCHTFLGVSLGDGHYPFSEGPL